MSPSKPSLNDGRTAPAQDEIARCAYQLWEEEGRPEGQDGKHWLAAELQLQSIHGKAPAKDGNAAYPSLPARDTIVENHTDSNEPVRKIPAASLKNRRR